MAGSAQDLFAHDFGLDRFQQEAGRAVDAGRNVLVAAPTGSGKTVVGEMAVAAALDSGGRAFYTAPIKALSNQKFNDLRGVLGAERVGLLTGDHSINPVAPVVVMTTEVLRNMVYAGSDALEELRWVVLDEVHFLQDAYRGPVWEEVLINTPARVRFACLSATVSNSAELGAWIESLRGPTTTVLEHRRPVELDPLMLIGDRHSETDHLIPLLVDGRPNAEGDRFDGDRSAPGRPGGRQRTKRRFRTPRRLEVVDRLSAESLLPAIYFIFSRKGCEEAAAACLDAGIRLTTAPEADRIRSVLDRHVQALADGDLAVLAYDRFAETLSRGVAAHHAGMVPAFREAVEECFAAGLIKVVFATETLALGINMPARSVVIERLTKFTGDGHDILTPAQFTQLTGRAGRRGIDDRGAAVVLWSPFMAFAPVAELAASREFPLTSVFRPTYNMAVNLVARHDQEQARAVLGRSFAQFQADAGVVGDRRRLEQRRVDRDAAADELDSMAGVGRREAMEYLELATSAQRSASRVQRGRSAVDRSLAALRPGDVLERGGAKGTRLVVVVASSERKHSVRVDAVTPRGKVVRIEGRNESVPVEACGRVDLPVPYAPRSADFRREAAARLRRVNRRRLRPPRRHDAPDESTRAYAAAAEALATHPLHDHGERDAILGAARRLRRAERDMATIESRLSRRGTDLIARFDAVVGILSELDHIELLGGHGDQDEHDRVPDWRLTAAGRRLRRIYHESDLLLSRSVGEGLFDDLDPPGLAALVSCVTHEHRSADPPPPPRLPTKDLQLRFERLCDLQADLARREEAAGLTPTPEPAAGFAMAAHRWTGGLGLEASLEEDMSGGDFVRNAKQLIDVLGQIADVGGDATARSARSASEALRRDVVDAGSGPQ